MFAIFLSAFKIVHNGSPKKMDLSVVLPIYRLLYFAAARIMFAANINIERLIFNVKSDINIMSNVATINFCSIAEVFYEK